MRRLRIQKMFQIALALVPLLSFFVVTARSAAVAVVTAKESKPGQSRGSTDRSDPGSIGPRCFDSEADLKAVAESVRKNSAKCAQTSLGGTKYGAYRNLLKGAPPTELAARLVYAETIAANCPESAREVSRAIADVVVNRVRRRAAGDSPVQSVVFECNQFASSLNQYQESRFKEFLCPRDQEAWSRALTDVEVALKADGGVPGPNAPVHYYLYRHSAKFKPPSWAVPGLATEVKTAASVDCIRVFKNQAWD